MLGEKHAACAISLNKLGGLYDDQGDYAAAERFFREAVALRKQVLGEKHFLYAQSTSNLASTLAALGKHEEAWPLAVQATTIYADNVEARLAVSAERQHVGLANQVRGSFTKLSSLVPPEQVRGADLLAAALRWKAGSARALKLRGEALAAGNPEAAKLYDDLKSARQQLVLLTLRGPAKEKPEAYQARLKKLEERRDSLEEKLASLVAGYAALRRADHAGPNEVASRLPPGAVLVEVVRGSRYNCRAKERKERWGPGHYVAVLLARGPEANKPVIRLVFLGDAEPIEEAMRDWRREAQRGPIAADTDRALRDAVWQPLAKALPEGTKQIIVSPDGQLALLPFEAIRQESGKYLIEDLRISYVSSGRDLMPLPDLKTKLGPALVLTDPDYEAVGDQEAKPAPQVGVPGGQRSADVERRGLSFRSLPGFRVEADAVGAPGTRPDRPTAPSASTAPRPAKSGWLATPARASFT